MNLKNRATRQVIFEHSWDRTEHRDANDTRDTIARLGQLRAEKAKPLGYPSYAAWKIEDQMAKTPAAALHFLDAIVPAATAKAAEEARDNEAIIDRQNGGFRLVVAESVLVKRADWVDPKGGLCGMISKPENTRFCHEGQFVELRFVPMCIRDIASLLGSYRDGSIHASHSWFGVRSGIVDGAALCQMCNRAIRGETRPNYLSTDNDPLYRFPQRQANLRVLEVTEIKTVPYVPLSHPFVERPIGTVRRECLHRTVFWTATDLEGKLLDFQHYYNEHRTHAGRQGHPPLTGANADRSRANLRSYRWQKHCRGLYQTPIAA